VTKSQVQIVNTSETELTQKAARLRQRQKDIRLIAFALLDFANRPGPYEVEESLISGRSKNYQQAVVYPT
jgi:hypothetical protein